MSERVEQLVDEFVVRFRRGEDPDLRAYLARAGDEAEAFAALVDGLLQAVPPPEVTAERLALSRAWLQGESPLLALRTERGLERAEVVERLRERLGIAEAKREKLRLRYHELETGQLEPERVDRRVWEALAEAFRAQVGDLAGWARPSRASVPRLAFYRRADADAAPGAVEWVSDEEPDEVDALFGVGRPAH
jgi:hypothetical protein